VPPTVCNEFFHWQNLTIESDLPFGEIEGKFYENVKLAFWLIVSICMSLPSLEILNFAYGQI
jgi:hypothetical protein